MSISFTLVIKISLIKKNIGIFLNCFFLNNPGYYNIFFDCTLRRRKTRIFITYFLFKSVQDLIFRLGDVY